MTGQFGYKGFFGVVDFNGSGPADVDRISDLMGSNLLSFRLGKQLPVQQARSRWSFWLGSSGQVIGLDTNGSVKLADVIPPPSQIHHRLDSARCAEFRPAIREDRRARTSPASSRSGGMARIPAASVQYSLKKKPEDVWNMLVGAQFALDRNWYFRTEVGFLGSRTSVLVATEYKFDF